MAAKPDISTKQLSPWDTYKDKKPDEALASIAKAEEKAKLPGALEVTLTHKAEPKKIRISLDKEAPVEFLGQVWSKLNIASGQHLLSVQTLSDLPQTIERVIEVAPSSIARVEVKFVS